VWQLAGRRALLLVGVWVAIGALGAFDEWHETFIPGRGAELMDWLMDMSGSAAGLVAGTLLMRQQWAARLLR
jgi:VanZ family protein